jgi:hypothetical protein
MDPTTLLTHLAKAIRDIEEGERQILQQKQILLELEHAGHDGTEARSRLAILGEMQAMHIWDKRRMMIAMAELSAGGSLALTATYVRIEPGERH